MTIMIQGTASSVGKSLITAGLCRIFKQDGYSVAPFKSQNMALNSSITREGLEMGRAQVVQAEAAGIEPAVDMNPILLKPTGDNRSQIILQGEVFEDREASGYYALRDRLVPRIRESFERLTARYDVVVLEGAGSPAEINLKDNDIVNMFMAKMARAPVLLVGDIDRGGVFASLTGTLLLLPEDERALVKGLLINKFRGDIRLLEGGLRQLSELTGRPVLGTIPYTRLDIDDEDSVSDRMRTSTSGALVDVAVICLPRISNFTDFSALARIPGLGIRYVQHPENLGNPDLILIPGTKNTMADLLVLRKEGMEARIKALAAQGTAIFGICGGYQMLGRRIADPFGVEQGGEIEGMGLLPLETIFEKTKVRTRVQGRLKDLPGILSGLSGAEVEGYEIHMGITLPSAETRDLAHIQDITTGEEKPDGAALGNIYGTYIHGIFDSDAVALALFKTLCAAKGLTPQNTGLSSYRDYKESQYDLLADTIRENVDMARVYRILEAGV
jgi:adenosylcobyric acid synthase